MGILVSLIASAMSYSTNQSECTSNQPSTTTMNTVSNTFNFDAWVKEKSLTLIKDAFIANKMTTIDTLNCNSTNFANLMQSICCDHSDMIDKVIKALQALQSQRERTNQTTKQFSCVMSCFFRVN